MDSMHEAFLELTALGAIVEYTNDTITIDRVRLAKLGYTLIFNLHEPAFVTLLDFSYMYNSIMFDGYVLPRSSLKSFVLLKIKNEYKSF